jgi:hypothetical protein
MIRHGRTPIAVALAFVWVTMPPLPARAQAAGVITGTVNGPAGPLASVTVQVLNAEGMIVGSATTGFDGRFAVSRLPPGTYTVQTLGSTGQVMATTIATLGAGAMTASVLVSATAAALAGTAIAAGGAAAAGAAAGGLGAATIVTSLAVAASAAGIVTVVVTADEASGRR